MQIIQSIRKRAAIATAAIAIAIIGFILLDAKNGSSKLFSGSSNSIGKIDGESIDANDFNMKVKDEEDKEGGRGGNYNSIREQVWNQVVGEAILNKEFDKLGMELSPKELSAILFSEDAPQALKQAFTDKTTGQYNIAAAEEWWTSQGKKAKGELKQQIENDIITPAKLQALIDKYSGLISAGAYYPSWMEEKDNADGKTFANISYVSVPYNTISDSAVKVSDDDIMAYVKDHEASYKQDGGRMISYVSFSANPSYQDSSNTLNDVQKLKADFIADTSAKKFLLKNGSTINFAEDEYILQSKMMSPKKDTIMSLPKGAVYGPYVDGTNIVLAKMIDTRIVPDSVKCRHILIATTDMKTGQQIMADSVAKRKIDSIADLIKNGANFDSLAKKFSDDPGSKDKGGVYDFPYYSSDPQTPSFKTLAKEFAETIFYGSTGDKKIVHTSFGWHYIEVMDQRKPEQAYKVAFMAREILASADTRNLANSQATKLSANARDVNAFNSYVTQNKLRKMDVPNVVKENDYQLNDLQDAREIIKWAFDAKEGEVSDKVFLVGDQYVVAVVDKVVPEGAPVDASVVRQSVEPIVRNRKKADMIISKIGKTPTLQQAASAYNVQIQNAGTDSSLLFNSYVVNGLGTEPKVIGASFNKTNQSKESDPIPGNSGVFIIKVNTIGTKPADTPEMTAQQNANKERNMVQQYGYQWFQALRKNADIKDNRSKFY